MKTPATADTIRAYLDGCASRRGSQRALALDIGVSTSLVSEVIRGSREPSGRILDWLGLKREVRYVKRNGK